MIYRRMSDSKTSTLPRNRTEMRADLELKATHLFRLVRYCSQYLEHGRLKLPQRLELEFQLDEAEVLLRRIGHIVGSRDIADLDEKSAIWRTERSALIGSRGSGDI
jgi:hypothetical protein